MPFILFGWFVEVYGSWSGFILALATKESVAFNLRLKEPDQRSEMRFDRHLKFAFSGGSPKSCVRRARSLYVLIRIGDRTLRLTGDPVDSDSLYFQ